MRPRILRTKSRAFSLRMISRSFSLLLRALLPSEPHLASNFLSTSHSDEYHPFFLSLVLPLLGFLLLIRLSLLSVRLLAPQLLLRLWIRSCFRSLGLGGSRPKRMSFNFLMVSNSLPRLHLSWRSEIRFRSQLILVLFLVHIFLGSLFVTLSVMLLSVLGQYLKLLSYVSLPTLECFLLGSLEMSHLSLQSYLMQVELYFEC